MFEIQDWDGLAKIGKYSVRNKTITTPALFPVVDPKQQVSEISDMRSKFGFEQVITSAYLMSKRIGHTSWSDYPKVSEYLDFDGLIMMDSGAYQVMLYGDIELGVEDTITLQSNVETDIGVIMDHPIGYDVNYQEAKRRVDQTLINAKESIQHLKEGVNWTLPIQGGKFPDLLRYYLKEIRDLKIIDHFQFFALGSVVQVMINQDYSTLVNMIAIARKYLPEDRPLHLFGAGHPSVFALATFLGCDTFDSAAYTLMAKDNRYMTVDGTYQLSDLIELPCSCPVCMSHTPSSLMKLKKDQRRHLISEHNLYVSSAEIKLIRQHIKDGNLWDLVLKRANSVPNLAIATRLAIEIVTTGDLKSKYLCGVPASKNSMIRVTRSIDLERPILTRYRNQLFKMIVKSKSKDIVILAFPLHRSIFGRIPDFQIDEFDQSKFQLLLYLPPIGLVPLGLSELYPIGQMINEIPMDKFPTGHLIDQLGELIKKGKGISIYYSDEVMTVFFNEISSYFSKEQLDIQVVDSLVTTLNTVTKS